MSRRGPMPSYLVGTAFTTSTGTRLGMSRSRLRAADLSRPHHGVRASGLDPLDFVDRCRAAEIAAGERGAVSHASALALWGVPVPAGVTAPEADIHIVTVRGRVRRPGIRSHEGGDPAWFLVSPVGVRTVAPATAWCQCAEDVTLTALVAMGDRLVTGRRTWRRRRGPAICSIDELREAVVAHGRRRGARMLRRALVLIRDGVDSAPETALRLLLVDAHLPEPVVGCRVRTVLGILEPDLAYPERRIAFEYEGDHHRMDRGQWRSDFERVRAFQQAGWTVIRVNGDDLADRTRRAALVDMVHGLLAEG